MGNKIKRKVYFVIGLALFIGSVIIFTRTQGDVLKTYNETVNRWMLEIAQDTKITSMLIMDSKEIFSDNSYVADMLPQNLGYSNRLENLNRIMENAIHIILFFVFTMSFLYLMTFTKHSILTKIILAATIGIAVNFWSEIYQNGISGRGYETIDIINNIAGIASAIVCFSFGSYMRNKWKKTKHKKVEPSNEIVIKYLSGKDFFDDQEME